STGCPVAGCQVLVTTTLAPTATFLDTARVLSVNNADPGGSAALTFNEAQPYKQIGVFSTDAFHSYSVEVAYADSLHNGTCGSGAVSAGLTGLATCVPSFAATFFQGTPGGDPGIAAFTPTHCTYAAGNCWDGAVIRITNIGSNSAVPEPSSLVLFGSGLLGIVGFSWRRIKQGTRKIG